ncbi:hypothetical protein [Colwellia sp. PAMC 21821]|uniref:hypothetical protein n=1 Tax=Colwellia sp. PAMC 21821 TaxID=1816219 RepID=UPI0009BD688B|nr:hypothetical protein [Colwellia sp. PAMC 21821]ARD44249.1 hypothetical protein A3Q33_07940 [Colwellia sp. PAMC 21821]
MKNNYLISLAILTLFSFATQAETLNTSLAECANIQESSARLICFDNLAAQAVTPKVVTPTAEILESVVTKPSKSVPTAKAKALMAPAALKAADFGAEHLKKPPVAEEDLQVVFMIEKLSKDPYGRWNFTFKNGQQWKQTDSAFLKLTVGDDVVLKKGFMNAVYLKKNLPNSSKKIRVKRLK